jgi:hypothetical protein
VLNGRPMLLAAIVDAEYVFAGREPSGIAGIF